jgi:3-deoxy-manno-octulosonate cytidylyltransferase (CMP-KDO synthetase)
MNIIAIIPVRMASTRLPGKPLADILGLPMVEHVRRRVSLSPLFKEVIVATCDQEILDVVLRYGGKALMTANTHTRCTDRVAEAVDALEADIVINVQGDEPLVNPAMFQALVEPLMNCPDLPCTNLMAAIDSDSDFNSPDVVKTVCDINGNAVYFSREPIPSVKKAESLIFPKYKQLGIIAFRKHFLLRFTSLPQTPLEKVESVDMLRAIEHGYKIRMVLSPFKAVGVDTPADLQRAIDLMGQDELFPRYR